jgi:hypothetical protein
VTEIVIGQHLYAAFKIMQVVENKREYFADLKISTGRQIADCGRLG